MAHLRLLSFILSSNSESLHQMLQYLRCLIQIYLLLKQTKAGPSHVSHSKVAQSLGSSKDHLCLTVVRRCMASQFKACNLHLLHLVVLTAMLELWLHHLQEETPHLLRLEVIPLRPHKEVALLHLLHRELNQLDTLRLHREPVLLLHLLQELLVERLLRLRREVFELNLKLLKPRFLNLLNHFSNHCSLNSHQLSHINPLNWLTSRLSRLKGPLNRHQSHHPHHQLLNLSSRSHNLILLLLRHHLLCLLKILPHLVEPHPHLRLLQT